MKHFSFSQVLQTVLLQPSQYEGQMRLNNTGSDLDSDVITGTNQIITTKLAEYLRT